MANVRKGRLDGVYGMKRRSAAELYKWADQLTYKAELTEAAQRRGEYDKDRHDDPKRLRAWASRIRKLADEKVQALEHKRSQVKSR